VNGGILGPSFTVRPAAQDEAGAIARLACDLGYPTDAETMRVRIRAVSQSPSDSLLVAAESCAITSGWIHAHSVHLIESGFCVEILGLVVSPSARRAGIGRALVAEVERWARSIRAEFVVVRSSVNRKESHAFYPALGYKPTKAQLVYRKPMLSAPSQ
jgi:GNAT superfamily N-acetyltransferase